jgi:hypothetical protein
MFDDDDDLPGLKRAARPPRPAPTPVADEELLTLLADASASLARLDEKLRSAREPIRTGWQARALLHEATASARLESIYVSADDLLLYLVHTLSRPADQDLVKAGLLHAMLGSAARRHPNQLFTPRRLLGVASLYLDRDDECVAEMPLWLQDKLADPTEIRDALQKVLNPRVMARWQSMPALLAAADLLDGWQSSRAADLVGGAAGRVLAASWLRRAGLTESLALMISTGFLGHALEYRPAPGLPWRKTFLRAASRAA